MKNTQDKLKAAILATRADNQDLIDEMPDKATTKAQKELGAKFDLRQFNDALVVGGGVPMVVLARNIDAFIAKRK